MHTGLQTFLIYSSFAVIIPFAASALRISKLQQPLRYLAILIFFDFLSEVIIHTCFFLKINNNFLWPIFISIEFGLLSWIYKKELQPTLVARAITYLIPVFITYTLMNWFDNRHAGLSAIPHFIEGIIILFFVLCYYYKMLKTPVPLQLKHQPMFWLSTGLFIYFSIDSVIFIFSNYIQSFSQHFNNQVWFVHAIFNIILYIFYTLAICSTPEKQV
jgi:hypothetical protein